MIHDNSLVPLELSVLQKISEPKEPKVDKYTLRWFLEKGVAVKGCVYRLIFAHLNPLNLCEQDQRHKLST